MHKSQPDRLRKAMSTLQGAWMFLYPAFSNRQHKKTEKQRYRKLVLLISHLDLRDPDGIVHLITAGYAPFPGVSGAITRIPHASQ